MEITFKQYLGLDPQHLHSFKRHDGGSDVLAQSSAILALRALQQDAKQHGFDLEVCSGFRSFERQAQLFGAKFLGQRPILDRNEQVISEPIVDEIERMRAILVFSALPGFSRHHFGSDFDIYASNCLPIGQSLQLTYHEYLPDSYFYEFGQYLKEALAKFDFANPYQSTLCESTNTSKEHTDQPQVGFEPWHISHLPSAKPYLAAYDPEYAIFYVSQQDLPFAPFVKAVMTPQQIDAMLRFEIC